MQLKMIKITYPEAIFLNGIYFRTPVTFEYYDEEAIEHIKRECIQKGYRFEIRDVTSEILQQESQPTQKEQPKKEDPKQQKQQPQQVQQQRQQNGDKKNQKKQQNVEQVEKVSQQQEDIQEQKVEEQKTEEQKQEEQKAEEITVSDHIETSDKNE